MGARDWHIARAGHHKEVAHFLADGGHHDWAAVALFYAAHQWVHSSLADEPGMHRDERHPRKHVSPRGADGRGTNQLVSDLFVDIAEAYRSLYDMGRRSRYDHDQLSQGMENDAVWKLLLMQHSTIEQFCVARNATRAKVSTQQEWSL